MTDEIMLQEAIQAIQQKDKARARDILTRLLKDDQKNAEYWVWMSATVETAKERTYCLQTALQFDPENAAAKRGLTMLGALPPDETVKPFPLKQNKVWEEDILMAGEAPKPKGFKAVAGNPLVRLAFLIIIGVGALAAVFFVVLAPRTAKFYPTRTPGPSPTFSPTVTSLPTRTPIYRTATPTFIGPTPLVALLKETYTPTPLYVQATHGVAARSAYDLGMADFKNGNWDNAIIFFQQVAEYEPGSADAHFYVAESYRNKGDNDQALIAYDAAIKADPSFGPAYLGRATLRKQINPKAKVFDDINNAVKNAPDFAPAYVARGEYYFADNNLDDALADFEKARDLSPVSPPVYYNLARTYLALGQDEDALAAAQKASELDITMLDNYLVLGEAYAANGELEEAMGALQTYVLYVPDNARALAILGTAYNQQGNYEAALEVLDKSFALDKFQGDVYLQRGIANLELEHGLRAENDFLDALRYFPRNFQAEIGIARSYYIRENYGVAYNKVEAARADAKTDEQMAQVLYWRAMSLEKMNSADLAYRDWKALLELPNSAVPAEWRDYASERITALSTSTPTKAVTATPTPSKTPSPTPTK